jgi:hypothetical protein
MLRSYGTERLVFKYSLKKIYSWKSFKAEHAFLVTLTREYLESIRFLAKVKKHSLPSPRKFGRTRCYLDRLRLNGADLSENCRCQRKARIGRVPPNLLRTSSRFANTLSSGGGRNACLQTPCVRVCRL